VHHGRRRPAGISAGRSAGARVLALTTTHDHDAVSDADAVVAGLSRVRARCTDDMIIIEID
jgi:mannitol-1-/sugar-/sorbitol-6-phosphatase